MTSTAKGILAALTAAVLFGASAPAAKLFLTHAGGARSLAPVLLAGLLYLGSGLGLALVDVGRRARRVAVAPLPRGGRRRFALAVVVGGVLAPALLMEGLARTSSATASLLLNLEGVLTALVAWVVVREHTDRRMVAGFLAIAAGGVLLSLDPLAGDGVGLLPSAGALLVVAACLGWAIDNNLTQAVSSADPVRLALVKGLVAGAVSTAFALATGAALPGAPVVAAIFVVGFLGYGASLVLFVVGLRHLGTARNGAYFSAAPFVGALLSFVLLGEPVGGVAAVAALLMAMGVAIHLTERHAHEHAHEELVHSHAHTHDEHHQHEHPPGLDARGPHTHEHRHAPLVHAHAHAPDLHHRHEH